MQLVVFVHAVQISSKLRLAHAADDQFAAGTAFGGKAGILLCESFERHADLVFVAARLGFEGQCKHGLGQHGHIHRTALGRVNGVANMQVKLGERDNIPGHCSLKFLMVGPEETHDLPGTNALGFLGGLDGHVRREFSGIHANAEVLDMALDVGRNLKDLSDKRAIQRRLQFGFLVTIDEHAFLAGDGTGAHRLQCVENFRNAHVGVRVGEKHRHHGPRRHSLGSHFPCIIPVKSASQVLLHQGVVYADNRFDQRGLRRCGI